MAKDLFKCDVSVCKAECCYNVPLTSFTLNTNKKRIVNAILRKERLDVTDEDGRVLFLPFTSERPSENKCPFLNERYRCNIYENRPRVCRKFGVSGESVFLNCRFLDKAKSNA